MGPLYMRLEKDKPEATTSDSTSDVNDVIELLELSVQGEQFCEERIAEVLSTGQGPSLEYLENLRLQYRRAKDTVIEKLRNSGVSDEELRRLAKCAGPLPPQD
jgi:hypothetical protein